VMSIIQNEGVIQGNLQKLTKGMKKLGYNSHMIGLAEKCINELQQKSVHGVNKFIQKLLSRVTEKEAYLDIFTEGRFAIILTRLKFSKIHIEYCDKGPDIKADWDNSTVYFEVTRSRPSEDDLAVQAAAAFVSQDTAENTISKIQGKIQQLQNDEINIVVLWSDTVNLDARLLKEAFEYFKQEIKQNPGTYKDLSAILFTEGEESYQTTLKKFYLLKNDEARKPLGICLTRKLKSLQKQNFKKMQREWEVTAAAMKRL
jgi:vesicle coat complex subunit